MADGAEVLFTSIVVAAGTSFVAGVDGLFVGITGLTTAVVVVVDGFSCVCLASDSVLIGGAGVFVLLDFGAATVATAGTLPATAAGTTFFSTLMLSFLTSSTFTLPTLTSSTLTLSTLTFSTLTFSPLKLLTLPLSTLMPSAGWLAIVAAMILANSTGFGLFTFAICGIFSGSCLMFAVAPPTLGTNVISTDGVRQTLLGGVVRTGFVLLRGVCLVRGKIPAVDGDIFCTGDRLTDGCADIDDVVGMVVRELGEMWTSRVSAVSDVEFND